MDEMQLAINEGQRIEKLTGNTDHYPIRYVVTIKGADGCRTLAFPAQGRNTYATAEEAQSKIDALLANNSAETLARFLKPEVRPCKCYPGHFDPCGVYFDTKEWLKSKEVTNG